MEKKIERERLKLITSIEKLLEGPITFLGFAWLILLIIEFTYGLNKPLETLSISIWIIFIIDFLIKFIVAPRKLPFLQKNIITIVSLVIPAIRLLRVLRVLRLIRGVRLIRVVGSLNRSMRGLANTMKRRGFAYVLLLTLVVTFGGAAGMLAIERGHTGFENYSDALWWTSMRVITAGSEYWPLTTEGRGLAFIIALYGYATFGYVTATLATFFIGRDSEERKQTMQKNTEIAELKKLIIQLNNKIDRSDQ